MEIATLLKDGKNGNDEAYDQLYQLIYKDLKQLAHKIRWNWRQADTLNTTALVHETYLKVRTSKSIEPRDKLHFYRLCGKAMRYVLHDYLDRKEADKRGGKESAKVSLTQAEGLAVRKPLDNERELYVVLECVKKLENEDQLLSQIVECRFFAELSINETANMLNISPATVKRKWSFARAFLINEIKKHA